MEYEQVFSHRFGLEGIISRSRYVKVEKRIFLLQKPLVPLEYLKMNLYVTPNRNGLAKFSNSKGASSASKVSLESNLDSKLLQFSIRGEEKRRGNVDSSETGSTQLRTEGRRLKGKEEGRKVRFRRGNLTGERVQRMGRMGDRVTLSRGERR